MESPHYQRVLSYLREEGRAYAQKYPASAGHLSASSDDQDVERLLEGFAFLASQLHARADDAIPELVQSLTRLLEPQHLRPVPACTIVEFEPAQGGQRARQRVPARSPLASDPSSRGGVCTFRTTADVSLVALEVIDADVDQARAREPVLWVRCRADANARTLALSDEGLRFFIAGEAPLATIVLLWLLEHCRAVELEGAAGRRLALPGATTSTPAFSDEFTMLEWPETAAPGLRILQEYFTLLAKFLFVDVRGISVASAVDDAFFERDEFTLRFCCPDAPPLPAALGPSSFRLGCAPAVNLFNASADPVRRGPGAGAQLVRPAGIQPERAEVYRVDSVLGVTPGRAKRREYRDFARFERSQTAAGGREGEVDHYFAVERRESSIDGGHDVFVRTLETRDSPPSLEREVLSIELTCTNRDAPASLDVGELCKPTAATPPGVRFRNITRVSRPARCPLTSELQWRLLSHLAIGHRSLAELVKLRELLSLYNFQAGADRIAGFANARRIESIRDLRTRPIVRMLDRVPVRGVQTTLRCDAEGFASEGDAYLFGCVIDRVLADVLPLNAFNELRMILSPSNRRFTWAPRSGVRELM